RESDQVGVEKRLRDSLQQLFLQLAAVAGQQVAHERVVEVGGDVAGAGVGVEPFDEGCHAAETAGDDAVLEADESDLQELDHVNTGPESPVCYDRRPFLEALPPDRIYQFLLSYVVLLFSLSVH